MMPSWVAWLVLAAASAIASAGLLGFRSVRARGLDRWLPSYVLRSSRRRRPESGEPVHLLLCIADHFEPHNGGVDDETARERVRRWVEDYPRLLGGFRDSDGRPPRHTFFYPIEQYEATHLDALAGLCDAGFGEVEVHLHHDRDTAENLWGTLMAARERLRDRHGLLSEHRETGAPAFGFIHGNWALDNARPDGRWCGVNNELDVLREAGCYADFTFPSAPSPTQPPTINSIYYALDDPERPRSHDRGIMAGPARAPDRALMMIQGPLTLNWRRRKWGLFPRVENACLQANQAPHIDRLDDWIRARVQVPSRPDWFFVKLHTHGAPEDNRRVLLGDPMVRFHQALARRAAEQEGFSYHYVTAREMYNLARAAEAGWAGSVDDARDLVLVRRPAGATVSGSCPNAVIR